ncbi:MAG: peptidoglycan endopeptidase [Nitrospirae bacterium]|nr:peptidoglycan endopeptidase [Nitrospirota bacterium]
MWRFSFIVLIVLLFFVNNGFAEGYKVEKDVKTYIIKKGDTLYKIAQDNNTTVKELKNLNNIKRGIIKPGQRLIISIKEEKLFTEHEEAETLINSNPSDEGLEGLDEKERLIIFAKKFLNIPYKFGGSSILGIDCSAFVQKIFAFLSIPLPRTAREQFSMGNDAQREDLSIGDLVFFTTHASFPSHVGIYIGDNMFIHASQKENKVIISNIHEPYYVKRFIGAKRLLESTNGIGEY